jgi:hypothetical protein
MTDENVCLQAKNYKPYYRLLIFIKNLLVKNQISGNIT